MTSILIQALTFAYASVGIVGAIGFIPTIKDLLNKKMSANISSYVLWAFCSGTIFLYNAIMFSDILLWFVTGVNFIGYTIVLGLSIFVKYSKR